MSLARAYALLLLASLALGTATQAAARVDILRSTGGLPPHIVGLFEEPLGFQQAPGGSYYVFDRRGHTVYAVDSDRSAARKLIEIGQEQGRVIQPRGFDVAPNGSFVVADAPRSAERVQIFGAAGIRTGGFLLPGRPTPAVVTGTLVLNGISSIRYTGERLIVSHPESGALFAEYSTGGWPLRSVGWLRDTGFEQDREVPFVTPTVRAAAVDRAGQLWILLALPFTYVYDTHGDKVRTVQFSAAGTISPTSLFFTQDGRLLVTPGCYECDPREK